MAKAMGTEAYTKLIFGSANIDQSADITAVTIAINLLLGWSGICLNSIVALYYLRKSNRGKTVPFLYTVMSVSNIITCILAILQAVILILDMKNNRNFFDHHKESLILSGYVIYCMVTRASMLHNFVLSIIRSINIWNPFQRINWHTIMAIFTAFYTLWLAIAIIDIYDLAATNDLEMKPWASSSRKFAIYELFRFPQPGDGTCHFFNKRSNKTTLCNRTSDPNIMSNITFILMVVFMIAPALMMFFASLHQCYIIAQKDQKRSKFVNQQERKSSKLTATILILSAICLITNATYESFYIIIYVAPTEVKFNLTLEWYKILTYYFCTTIHVIHAVLEPFVFIVRGQKLRSHLLVLVKRLDSSKLSSRHMQPDKPSKKHAG